MPIEPLLPTPPLVALPRLLEVSHVAHRLSVSPRYVRQLIRDKKLPVIRLGQRLRVDASDLQAFIDAQRDGIDERRTHGGDRRQHPRDPATDRRDPNRGDA